MLSLIQVTEPEVIPPITHLNIVNVKWEKARLWMERPGSIQIWLCRVYLHEGEWYEDPRVGPYEFNIEGELYIELAERLTSTKPLIEDESDIIGQFLLDNGLLPPGTVVEV